MLDYTWNLETRLKNIECLDCLKIDILKYLNNNKNS